MAHGSQSNVGSITYTSSGGARAICAVPRHGRPPGPGPRWPAPRTYTLFHAPLIMGQRYAADGVIHGAANTGIGDGVTVATQGAGSCERPLCDAHLANGAAAVAVVITTERHQRTPHAIHSASPPCSPESHLDESANYVDAKSYVFRRLGTRAVKDCRQGAVGFMPVQTSLPASSSPSDRNCESAQSSAERAAEKTVTLHSTHRTSRGNQPK